MAMNPTIANVASASVLALGASGYVGAHLVPRLLQEGRRVRAAARGLEALRREGWRDAELVSADVLARTPCARRCAACRRSIFSCT